MEERAAEENEVVEKDGERKAERMGSEAMKSSAHLADLAYLASISLLPFIFFISSSTPHRSRLSFSFVAMG